MLAHTRSLGYSVKEFLCVNGGEFDNKDVREILYSNRITQRLTAPYTPEKNEANEREMRTTIEMARTFKYSNSEVSIPAAIWAELFNSAIYMPKRTGKSSIENAKEKENGHKTIQGYLVGCDGGKRYRNWLKKEHKIILSRDVIFQEEAGKCDEHAELKLEDRIREDTNQGKHEEQLIKIEDNPIERTQSQEDLSDSKTDREEAAEPTSDRQLRTFAETKTV
ncbi:integrase catalytic domain-containing protein [Trichonephila clavipes]|nr:integrase catalytic domain-containing protein [Trichonephila clavipes]